MKLMSEKLPDLRSLYTKELRLLLSGEEQSVWGLLRMAAAARDSELKKALQGHIDETEEHAKRLRAILEGLHGESSLIKCKTVDALLAEAEDLIEDASDDAVRDAALIATAQRLEHYKIAGYGALRHFAWVLGRDEDAKLLNESIDDGRRADRDLTRVAERINPTARKAA